MGDETFSRAAYVSAKAKHVPSDEGVTVKAEQKAHETGKLHPLVDPAGYGVIRRSLLRFERERELWKLTVGPSIPIETRVDTTGSMGHNVDIAMQVLPTAFELFTAVLPGYDVHIATGIFGDVQDCFVLCRPQFEMVADRIVEQLTLMVPERAGGDTPEDPHYGLFGGAYLVAAYINRIGLLGYDFTVSDAPARDQLDEQTLVRIYGDEVFDKAAENGHQINRRSLPTTKDVVDDLQRRAHAFFLQVGDVRETTRFWTRVFGQNRVIILPDTNLTPQVQATIIGLTEGTLELSGVSDFLRYYNVSAEDAQKIGRSVANIPIGAQAALPNFGKLPKAGDLFREKTDLWPVGKEELHSESSDAGEQSEGGVDWL